MATSKNDGPAGRLKCRIEHGGIMRNVITPEWLQGPLLLALLAAPTMADAIQVLTEWKPPAIVPKTATGYTLRVRPADEEQKT